VPSVEGVHVTRNRIQLGIKDSVKKPHQY